MGALTLCDDSTAQQEEKRSLFPPGKDSANVKSQTLYYNPHNFLLFSTNVFFPCHMGTCMWLAMVADTELQFSADLK